MNLISAAPYTRKSMHL